MYQKAKFDQTFKHASISFFFLFIYAYTHIAHIARITINELGSVDLTNKIYFNTMINNNIQISIYLIQTLRMRLHSRQVVNAHAEHCRCWYIFFYEQWAHLFKCNSVVDFIASFFVRSFVIHQFKLDRLYDKNPFFSLLFSLISFSFFLVCHFNRIQNVICLLSFI